MTDKERLENMSPIGFDLDGNVLLKGEDYHWLMEQAQLAQEFENHLNIYDFWYRIAYDQNKRYREALINIYELAEYDEYDNTLEQIVSEIKKALEGTE